MSLLQSYLNNRSTSPDKNKLAESLLETADRQLKRLEQIVYSDHYLIDQSDKIAELEKINQELRVERAEQDMALLQLKHCDY